MTKNTWDVIIIGGGAAGLMAAACANQRDKNVLLLEKNNKLGVKILMSGGTRCNITHACDSRGIVEAFGRNGKFLFSALAALPPDDVVRLIEEQGVATKIEPGGKVFPISDRALDVRDALVRLATQKRNGHQATLRVGEGVTSIQREADSFTVVTPSQAYRAPSVIITTGGKSYPGCGTTGDGYAWASRFGHAIVRTVPALTPLLNEDRWSHQLKGLTLGDVAIDVRATLEQTGADRVPSKHAQKALDTQRGSFLFTHFGFSGPAVLNISRVVTRYHSARELTLCCDFSPDCNPEQFRMHLKTQLQDHPKQQLASVLSQRFTRRFVDASLIRLGLTPDLRASEVSNKQLVQLTQHFKQAQFPLAGAYGFKKAEVTAGGVDLGEIDSRTMQSKICPGLFFAGEILDLDGWIGGYNFQAAFSTGWLAGLNC